MCKNNNTLLLNFFKKNLFNFVQENKICSTRDFISAPPHENQRARNDFRQFRSLTWDESKQDITTQSRRTNARYVSGENVHCVVSIFSYIID